MREEEPISIHKLKRIERNIEKENFGKREKRGEGRKKMNAQMLVLIAIGPWATRFFVVVCLDG